MEKWIEKLSQDCVSEMEKHGKGEQTRPMSLCPDFILKVIFEIEQLEETLETLTETHNDLLKCRDSDLPKILRDNKQLTAIVEAMRTIKQILGYGIYGCPTDGEYHIKTYQQAFDIAKQALAKWEKEAKHGKAS